MDTLYNKIVKLDAQTEPRLYITNLLELASSHFNLIGGGVYTFQDLQVRLRAHNLSGEELNALAKFIYSTSQEEEKILTGKNIPHTLISQGVKAMFITPILGSGKNLGFCLWLSEENWNSWNDPEFRHIHLLISLSLSWVQLQEDYSSQLVYLEQEVLEKKSAQELSRTLSEEIGLLLESTGEGIYGIDLEGNCTFINKAASHMLGYESWELMGRNIHDYIHHTRKDGTPFPKEECSIHTYNDGTGHRNQDDLLWCKDGTSFPAVASSFPIIRDNKMVGAVVTFTDITSRILNEEKLYQLTKEIVDELDLCIAILDADCNILTTNRAWQEITSKHPEVFIDINEGDNFLNFCSKPNQPEFESMLKGFAQGYKNLLETGQEYTKEYPIELKGETRWFLGRVSAMQRSGEKRLLMSHLDITKRKEAENRSLRLAKNIRLVLDSTSEGIFGVDTNGKVTFANKVTCEMLGYKSQELQGQIIHSLIHHTKVDGSPYPLKDCPVIQTLKQKVNTHVERDIFWHKDGSPIPVKYSIAPMVDQDKVNGAVVILSDLSRLMDAEEAMREAEDFAQVVVNSMSARIAILDNEGVIIGVNRAWREYSQAKKGLSMATPGQNYIDICEKVLHNRHARVGAQGIKSVAHGDQSEFVYEYPAMFKDKIRWFEATIQRLSETRLIVIHNDITKNKEAADAMKLAKEAAEESNRAKSQFLASMSHEIRTPMNSIIGMADLLEETELTQIQKRYVQIFRTAGSHLLSIIDDILDLSKIESSHLLLERVDFYTHELINDVLGFMEVNANQKNLKLNKVVSTGVPKIQSGDSARIRQVIINLLGNAVKFTQQGEVTLEVKINPSNHNELLFAVKDTGPGIPQDKLDEIFGAFNQLDSSTTRQFGGSGLGLAISRRLVNLMGGEIWVNSTVGKGSVFYFTLPLSSSNPSSKEKTILTNDTATRSVPAQGKVLLVEDAPDNVLLIQAYVNKEPWQIDVAENGKIATDMFKKQDYDLVLMDIEMPVMDGFTATKEIREWEKKFHLIPTPIVALTAYAFEGDRQKCFESGCSDYLTKPIRKAKLIEILTKYMGKGGISD